MRMVSWAGAAVGSESSAPSAMTSIASRAMDFVVMGSSWGCASPGILARLTHLPDGGRFGRGRLRGRRARRTHGRRRGDLLHRLLDGTGRARPGAGGARGRVPLGSRALAHPALARLRLPGGRRAAQEVLRRDGSVRDPGRRRGGHHAAVGGDRDLPGGPARPDPDRQGGGEPRPGLGRALPVRHRGGLERGGDGRPRHRVQVALRGDARAGGGDAAHLDEVQARVRGRVRQVPADDDVAQAGAEAAPTGAGRRRVPPRGAPGAGLRRRLGAARAPARLRRRARQAARVRRARPGGRPGSGRGADHRLRGGRGRGPDQALPRRGRGPPHLQPPFRQGRRGAPRARSLRSPHATGAVLMATHKPAFEQIASGLRFPEGPVAMADGSVILVEIERRTLSRVTPDGKVHVIANLGGGPNGAAMGPGGKIYVTNNGGRKFLERPGKLFPVAQADDYATGSIQIVDPETGKFETLYDRCDGRRLNGPNDLVFDGTGGFWFTDLGKTRERDSDRGVVYYAKADGSMIREAIFPLERPNGIGLSPDEKTLYVVETPTARCWAFKLSGPGQIESANGPYRGEKGTVVVGLGGYQMFDSLAVDGEGHVCVATLITGAVSDIWPDGSWVDQYALPDMMVTNVCFGGPELRTAFSTLSMGGTLVSFEWPRPGLALSYLNR